MKIDVECLVPKTNKSGRTNYYWQPSAALKRSGWKSLPLGTDTDAAIAAAKAQNARVAQWKAGGEKPAAVRRMVRLLTVSALIARYKAAGWPSVKQPGKAVAEGTRETYGAMFKTIEAWAGDVPLAAIDSARVGVFRDALMQPAATGRYKGQVRHTAAHSTLRVLRTLFTYAEQKGLIPKGTNPADSFGLSKPDPREQIWWEPAREALLATAAALPEAEGLDMAVAVDLAFTIGQREGDLIRLAVSQYVAIPAHKMDPDVYATLAAVAVPAYAGRPGYVPADVAGIRIRQSKGKRWVEVPVIGATRARVEAAIARAKAADCTTMLVDHRPDPKDRAWRARPWTAPNLSSGQTRFQRRFAALRAATIDALLRRYGDHDDEIALEIALEIDDLQYRDFRRTAVVVMGELGIADHLIAAITGHSLDETKKILDTYLPRTTGMAARAIALRQARGTAEIVGRENSA